MAKKDDTNKGKIERVDPETGEVTYIDPETVEDAEIVPEGEGGEDFVPGDAEPTSSDEPVTMEQVQEYLGEFAPAAEGGEPAVEPTEPDEGLADPERVHAYDAGEFNPEFQKLEGQIRNFMLDRIRNNWKPWQQMTVDEQQQLVNAIEMQARDTIRGTVRALNDFEWEHCMVTLGQVTLKGGDKGIEAKITCANVDENRNFLGEHIDSQVMILSTNAETFFGARDKVKYDGRGSQMDLPLGGSIKDIEAGGFEAEAAALQDPAPTEAEEPTTAPVLADGEGAPDWNSPGGWPDDEQLGERQEADDDDMTPHPVDTPAEPGEA
jgi:hypothetical protein